MVALLTAYVDLCGDEFMLSAFQSAKSPMGGNVVLIDNLIPNSQYGTESDRSPIRSYGSSSPESPVG